MEMRMYVKLNKAHQSVKGQRANFIICSVPVVSARLYFISKARMAFKSIKR